MPVTAFSPFPGDRVDIVVELDQPLLGLERILGVLRVRGYRLHRVELAAPGRYALTVAGDPAALALLLPRLQRLVGTHVVHHAATAP